MTDGGFSFAALKSYLINALAAAALLGGGATVIDAKVTNARQDAEITATAEALKAIPEIQKDVRETRDTVIRLEAQQGKDR